MKKFALTFLLYLPCYASDLGKHGSTFDIKENDLLTVIESKLASLQESGELSEISKNLQNKMINSPARVLGITKVTEEKTRKLDPTVLLDQDIVVDNKVLYKKGTKINPLDYTDFQKLIFIDQRDEKQTNFAHEIAKKDNEAVIILVDGKPGEHKIDDKTYFYFFDQLGTYTKRFEIKRVPSIVYQEGGEKVLSIKEVLLEDDKKDV